MEHQLRYTLKVWLTACFLAPALWMIYEEGLPHFDFGSVFSLLIFFPLFSAIFSLPSFVVLSVVVYLTCKYVKINVVLSRLLWSVIGAGLTALPFYFFLSDVFLGGEGFGSMPYAYAIFIVVGIWFYRIEPKEHTSNEDERSLFSETHP